MRFRWNDLPKVNNKYPIFFFVYKSAIISSLPQQQCKSKFWLHSECVVASGTPCQPFQRRCDLLGPRGPPDNLVLSCHQKAAALCQLPRRSGHIFGALFLSLCTDCNSTGTSLSIEHPYAKCLQGLQKHYLSLSLWIPMERVGDQDAYFATEESDLAKVTWATGGGGSGCLFPSTQAAPLTKCRAAAAASLLKEEKMSRAIKTLAAGRKLITS